MVNHRQRLPLAQNRFGNIKIDWLSENYRNLRRYHFSNFSRSNSGENFYPYIPLILNVTKDHVRILGPPLPRIQAR